MPLHQMTPYLSIVIAYLLGSIPTSYIIGKVFFGTDIRRSGSGNAGATNALRTFGKKAGVAVLVIDILKGVAAILIGKAMGQSLTGYGSIHWLVAGCGLAAILGHIFSVFLKFKGGKGVATAAGVFLALSPLTLLFCLVFFSFVVYTTKYVSLGSLLTAFAFLLIELGVQVIMRFSNLPKVYLVIVVVAIIFYSHRANIKRLAARTEPKFGQKVRQQEI